MNNYFLLFLKKKFRKYLSYPLLIIISFIRAINIKNQKIVDSKLTLGLSWNLLYKMSGLQREICISAEGKKLCVYNITNQGIESFEVNSLTKQLKLEANDAITYCIFNNSILRKYLLINLYTNYFLDFISHNYNEKLFIYESIKTIKINLRELNKNNFDYKNSKIFNYRYEGSIQYFKNSHNTSFLLSFRNSSILANK